MSNPLNFPHSPNSYMMEGKHRNREVASKPYNHEAPGFYRALSWILGFKEKYSLLNCKRNSVPPSLLAHHVLRGFVWGGALVGFCLARALTMNPARTADAMPAGIALLP
jgi:hypothetical protein